MPFVRCASIARRELREHVPTKMSPPLLRSLCWFLACAVMHVALSLVLWRRAQVSCTTAATSRMLLTLLFASRGLLELYAHFYSSANAAALFRGRSALFVRLVLSFTLIVCASFAVVEGAGAVFSFELTPKPTSAAPQGAEQQQQQQQQPPVLVPSIMRHDSFRHGKSPLESDHIAPRMSTPAADQHRRDSTTDRYRRRAAHAAASTARRVAYNGRRDDDDPEEAALPPGAPPYNELLLHAMPLCTLSTAVVSVLAAWFIHVVAALLAHVITLHTYYRPLRQRRGAQQPQQQQTKRGTTFAPKEKDDDDDGDVGGGGRGGDNSNAVPADRFDEAGEAELREIERAGPVWCLSVDLLTELALASSISVLSVLLHIASHVWMLDAEHEVAPYLSLVTGSLIFYFEGHGVMAAAQALTLSLGDEDAWLVEQLETELKRDVQSLSFVCERVRAYKTECGRLGLVIERGNDACGHDHDHDCGSHTRPFDEDVARAEVVALLRTSSKQLERIIHPEKVQFAS